MMVREVRWVTGESLHWNWCKRNRVRIPDSTCPWKKRLTIFLERGQAGDGKKGRELVEIFIPLVPPWEVTSIWFPQWKVTVLSRQVPPTPQSSVVPIPAPSPCPFRSKSHNSSAITDLSLHICGSLHSVHNFVNSPLVHKIFNSSWFECAICFLLRTQLIEPCKLCFWSRSATPPLFSKHSVLFYSSCVCTFHAGFKLMAFPLFLTSWLLKVVLLIKPPLIPPWAELGAPSVILYVYNFDNTLCCVHLENG